MRIQIRIRPRFWLALRTMHTRWSWVPLSLIFRKQRLPERLTPGAPGSQTSWFRAFSFVSHNNHFYAYEKNKIVRRSVQHRHFSVARATVERPASAGALGHRNITVLNMPLRERSVETQLRSSILRDHRQSFTIERQLREITKQVAEVQGQGARPIESMTAAPAQRLLTPPRLFRPRIGDPSSSRPESHREPFRAIHRKTFDLLVEEQITPRLRREELPAAPDPGFRFSPRLVEQVWRQPKQSSPEPSSERPALPTVSQTIIAESPVPTRIAPSGLTPATMPVLVPTKIEGPAMERLAEDVMKRIERHLRIERERRGI
jgi:hypothetical protein